MLIALWKTTGKTALRFARLFKEVGHSALSKALAQELAWASHLILPAVCVELRGLNCVNLASYLAPALSGHSQVCGSECQPLSVVQYWLKVPLSSSASAKESASGRPSSDPWEWWDTCRTLCDNSRSLGVGGLLLEDVITDSLHSSGRFRRSSCTQSSGTVARRANQSTFRSNKVLLGRETISDDKHSIFLTNPKGYPVLSKAHQAVVKSLLKVLIPRLVFKLIILECRIAHN